MASVYSEYAALGLSFALVMKEMGPKDIVLSFGQRDPGKKPTDMDDCPCFLEDIVILAEFSEVLGPIPLLTVPLNTKDLEIDLDDFILKIMSVDYQASASGNFRFTTDTQVLQTDVIDGVHAYIHYFTLNDVNARGFVRPMCLAYISRDRSKLETKLSILKANFLQASGAMKGENNVLFLEEVSLGLQQLKDLQQKYFRWKQSMEEEEGESETSEDVALMASTNLDQLVEQQIEYNKILQSARSILENKDLCESLSPWKDTFCASSLPEIEQYMAYVKLVVGNHEPMIPNQRRGDTELRPIAALSPFGVAISVWHLCCTRSQFEGCDLALTGGCFWWQRAEEHVGHRMGQVAASMTSKSSKIEAQQAVASKLYRQLLLLLIPTSVPISYESRLPPIPVNNKEITIQIVSGKVVSDKVGSCKDSDTGYYSSKESVTKKDEMCSEKLSTYTEQSFEPRSVPSLDSLNSGAYPKGTIYEKSLKSTDLTSDIESNDDSVEAADSAVSEVFEFPVKELWCQCIWTASTGGASSNPVAKIQHFFQTFSKVAQHILYSLLIGRTLVIAGSNSLREKVLKIISAVLYFVPVRENSRYLRWHRGILVPAHIEHYKVIGLCIPERLTIHDMISPRDKNAVTILDVNTKKILGPAYCGALLAGLHENFDQNFVCPEALVLYIQSVLTGIHQKVLLFEALSLGQPKVRARITKDAMNTLGLKGRDLDIIHHLKMYVKM
ncbi:uncharacterized protein [Hetaerina americana]|uniref:uncharacterized protein n=1 Tax=Hetaerina americana TaxID=62018 RepID=UPI003A7F21C9